MITDKERRELIANARRMVKETNFCADMCLRFAADAERDARAKEQAKLRDMARRFHAQHGRTLPGRCSAEIIQFPANRTRRPSL